MTSHETSLRGRSLRDVVSRNSELTGPLLALDGMSLAFRAYFALPTTLATSDGVVTNAVHGFAAMMTNLVKTQAPSGLVVAFDLPEATFRDEIVEEYKGGRAETPDDLLPQFDMIRELLTALSIPVLEAPRFEADDILATLAHRYFEGGNEIVIVSGDRDLFQVVRDPYVKMLYNRKGVSDYDLYDEDGIVARTGVTPSLYPSLAALRGDPSDNLPGIPGVGEKTAAKLLATYGTLDAIFDHVDELTPKLRENLVTHESRARSNAKVIPLRTDVEIGDGSNFTLGNWDYSRAKECFARFELRTQWTRVEALLLNGSLGQPNADSSLPTRGDVGEDEGETTYRDDKGDKDRATRDAPKSRPAPPLGGEVDLSSPRNVAEALQLLGSLREPRGNEFVAAAAIWDGEPGRSSLAGLVFCSRSCDRFIWIERELLVESSIVEHVNAAFGEQGLVGDGMKELFRSLIPTGVECRNLTMDTGVAEFLIGEARDELKESSPTLTLHDAAGNTDRSGEFALQDGEYAETIRSCATALAARVGSVPYNFELLDERGMRVLHDEVETPLVRVLAKMEITGVRVDVDELTRIAESLKTETEELKSQIFGFAGHELNVNSTPQLRTVLFEELGLTPGRKTKTGFSTDVSTLELLRGEHPIVEALLKYREIEKLRSTYGVSLLKEVAQDGRIHASFRQTVTRTGRISSEHPNLHNIPTRTDAGAQFRKVFIPEDRWSFLAADYDQIELRVLAHLSSDSGLLEAFRSETDVHRAVASGVYATPVDKVTHAQRERAKMVSYGLIYGMEPFGLARRLATSVDEAREIMNRYFSAFPDVQNYMKQVVAQAREKGYTSTPMGRRRYLPDLASSNKNLRLSAERQAMNAGIQGFAADIFKIALVRLDDALESMGLDSRIVLQVHDEVLLEVARGEEEVVGQVTLETMRGASELLVPLEVSMGWGESWSIAKAPD